MFPDGWNSHGHSKHPQRLPYNSHGEAPFLGHTKDTKDRAERIFPPGNQGPTDPSRSARNLVLRSQGRERSGSRFNSCFPEGRELHKVGTQQVATIIVIIVHYMCRDGLASGPQGCVDEPKDTDLPL